MSGHTPPDRPDLAATASFLRELPAQLSESEPIELAAPPRRRTRLLVAVAASVVAVVGLAGVVTLRGGEDVVRPAVGGASAGDVTTIAVCYEHNHQSSRYSAFFCTQSPLGRLRSTAPHR